MSDYWWEHLKTRSPSKDLISAVTFKAAQEGFHHKGEQNKPEIFDCNIGFLIFKGFCEPTNTEHVTDMKPSGFWSADSWFQEAPYCWDDRDLKMQRL